MNREFRMDVTTAFDLKMKYFDLKKIMRSLFVTSVGLFFLGLFSLLSGIFWSMNSGLQWWKKAVVGIVSTGHSYMAWLTGFSFLSVVILIVGLFWIASSTTKKRLKFCVILIAILSIIHAIYLFLLLLLYTTRIYNIMFIPFLTRIFYGATYIAPMILFGVISLGLCLIGIELSPLMGRLGKLLIGLSLISFIVTVFYDITRLIWLFITQGFANMIKTQTVYEPSAFGYMFLGLALVLLRYYIRDYYYYQFYRPRFTNPVLATEGERVRVEFPDALVRSISDSTIEEATDKN